MKICPILTVVLLVLSVCMSAIAIDLRDEIFTTRNAGRVVFSHKFHISQPGMAGNCKACHDGIFNIKKRTKSSMSDMAKGKSCGACHNGRQAFALTDCAHCHETKEITYAVKATGSTLFSHNRHLAVVSDCSTCHPVLFAAGRNRTFTMADMKKGKSCGACHNGKKAFPLDNCTKCHPTRELTFKVKEIRDAVFSHASHLGMYTCGDCHVSIFAASRSTTRVSMGAMAKGKSCGACHNGESAFSVTGNCDACHAK